MARYLQQWVVAWNGYDGNIYITTADTLPSFQPPRVLLAKQSEEQKFWYPNIIHQQLGHMEYILISFHCYLLYSYCSR